MTSVKEVQLLSQVHLFRKLQSEQLDALATRMPRAEFRAAETIFFQGDPGSMFYIIIAGQVKIVSTSPEGEELILAILSDGDFFGELSLLDQEPRSASAIAMTQVLTLTLRRDDFLDFVTRYPGATAEVLSVLSRRLRKTNCYVEDAVFLDLPARLAKRLLELGQRHGVKNDKGVEIGLRLSQQDLAAMVGSSRVSVSKQMSLFQSEGVVSIDKQHITILRPDELKRRV